jgi:hypothetical protein
MAVSRGGMAVSRGGKLQTLASNPFIC